MDSRLFALVGALCWTLVSVPASGEDLQPVSVFEHLPAVPAGDNNAWPAEWEKAFRARLAAVLAREEHRAPSAAWSGEKSGGGFMALLKGRRQEALAAMRVQGPAAHTAGIDYYWCFHLEKQPRIYFQFGKFQPGEFVARMKEGAKLWTAEDPRPNLELVLQLDCPDADVAAHARKQLAAMWRTADQVREMVAQARSECKGGQPANKLRFADYLESVLPRWPKAMPADAAGWRAWWGLIAAGDWMIFEEYERRTNPRPHPKYGIGTGPVGAAWDPGVRGGWVDWRNTDNLRSMREVAVYLFAEETGNELVRKVYRERIRRTARSFYSVGNGEWDSPAYLGLTIAGYMGLFDFARDREVRLLAKGTVDYLVTTAAVKYFHAGAAGPNTRDYGTWSSGDGGGASRLWSTWLPEPNWPVPANLADMAFLSAYRPPAAVVALANNEAALPWELLASHPVYSNWLPGADDAPGYHETQYRSRDFQMGSQVEGGTHDGCGCKIVLAHPTRGCDYLIATANRKGNPCVGGNDRIAQCRNALIWLNGSRKDAAGAWQGAAWRVLMPGDAAIEREGDVVFLRFARCWAALHPIRCTFGQADPSLVNPYAGKRGGGKLVDSSGNAGVVGSRYTVLPAAGAAAPLTGLAIELADELHFADYAAFRAAVLGKSKVHATDGGADFAAASGARVAMAWDGKAVLPEVKRDGKAHDWSNHRALWQAGSTKSAPVSLGWKEGRLRVSAGGRHFSGTMDLAKGTYKFE